MSDKETINARVDELYRIIASLKTKKDVEDFFIDLCTYKEIEQMAQRAHSAKLFLEGKTYTQIIEETELSSTTLSRVSRSISYGTGGYAKFIKRGKKNEKK